MHECENVMKTIRILPRPASGLQVVVSDAKSLTLPEMGNQLQGVQRRIVLVVNRFHIFEFILFCFVVAVFDLVHNVEAIHDLS